MTEDRIRVLMIVPEPLVKGGIASVVNGYRGSSLEQKNELIYIESYCNGSKWKKLGKALKAYVEFQKAIRKKKPDVVHIHSSFGPSFYRKMPFILLSSSKGIPVINHIHGAEFDRFYEQASPRKQRLVRKIYNKCTRLIVLSEEWKEKMMQIVPEEKVVVVPNYSRIPRSICQEKRKPLQILFMGELGQRKGCYDIPEIFQRISGHIEDARLIMAGDGELDQVRQAFADRNLQDKVDFPGWVRGEEKEKLLQESSVFLFPSYHEGMPMVVLEAMAYELGIVTTNVGGIPQLILNGQNGFCEKPGDTDSMSRDLMTLLTDEDLRKRFGYAARELVDEKYGLESHLQKLQKIYREVCR